MHRCRCPSTHPGHFKPSARHALQEVGGSRSVRILIILGLSEILILSSVSLFHDYLGWHIIYPIFRHSLSTSRHENWCGKQAFKRTCRLLEPQQFVSGSSATISSGQRMKGLLAKVWWPSSTGCGAFLDVALRVAVSNEPSIHLLSWFVTTARKIVVVDVNSS